MHSYHNCMQVNFVTSSQVLQIRAQQNVDIGDQMQQNTCKRHMLTAHHSIQQSIYKTIQSLMIQNQ